MPALSAKFEGVWKAYPRWLPGRRSIRAMATRRIRMAARTKETRWALQNVSFDLHDGESMGLVGHNGAGKSTLLRLSSGLGDITRGRILVSPEVASVLNLGTTLSADLTGRENALTATLLAGIRRADADRTVRDALEFAELQEFADSPVRSYSDGMKLRLAFGVVAQLTPDVLLLDEVIAVGDLQFTEKCMTRIDERREAGMGLLFASHDLEQIEEQCDRAIWLDRGRIRAIGEAEQVVEQYREATHTETFERTPQPTAEPTGELELQTNRFGSQEVTIEDVRLHGSVTADTVEQQGTLLVDFTMRREGAPVSNPIASVTVSRVEGDIICCESSTDDEDIKLGDLQGELGVGFRWEGIELLPGEYVVDVGVFESGWEYAYDYHWQAYSFTVQGESHSKALFHARRQQWTVAG